MGVNTDDMRAAVRGWRDAESQSRSEFYLAVTLCGLADVAADEIDSLRADVDELRAEVDALLAKDKARRLSDAGDRRDWDACDAIEAERPDSEAP